MSEEHIHVAIIGAGYTAYEHLRAFTDLPDIKVTGIYSRTRPRAENLVSQLEGANVYDSTETLYEGTKADLVVITVTEESIREVSEAAFRFPWTVFMEKPPGFNLQDALSIKSAAVSHGRDVYVGLNRRFLAATQQVLKQLSGSQERRIIRVEDQQDLDAARQLGRPKHVVHNWMFANSIHTIDYFRTMGRGGIVEVKNVLPWDPDDPGPMLSYLSYSSGDIGIYEGLWNMPGPWAVTVSTPTRRWEMRPLEQAITQPRGGSPESLPSDKWDEQFKPGFRRQAQEVVNAVRQRPSKAPTLDEAIHTMELIDSLYRSCRS